jgi:hypothetical protein
MIDETLRIWCLSNKWLIRECCFSEDVVKNECFITIMPTENNLVGELGKRLNECIQAFPAGMKCQLTFLPFSIKDMKYVYHQKSLDHQDKLWSSGNLT